MGLVIEKTARILQLVSEREPCSLKDLTAATGMNKSTLFLILKSLVEVGFLAKGDDSSYSLGQALFRLTGKRRYAERLRLFAQDIAEQLRHDVDEAANVNTIDGISYTRIAASDTLQAVKVDNDLLNQTRFYRSATVRVLLAHALPELRERIIAAIGLPIQEDWPGISDHEQLIAALDRIRSDGIADRVIANGQVIYLAVPVARPGGEAPVAIGVCMPAFRFKDQHRVLVLKCLYPAARRLALILAET